MARINSVLEGIWSGFLPKGPVGGKFQHDNRIMQRLLPLQRLFRRSVVERDLHDELSFHLERLIESNVASGMSPAEARAAAIRRFGGLEQVKEDCRDASGIHFLEQLLRDIAYSARMLVKRPIYAAAVVVTLTVGFGANMAVFSVVKNIFFQPLPFQDSANLYSLQGSMTDAREQRVGFKITEPNFVRLSDATHDFLRLSAQRAEDMTLTGMHGPETISVVFTSPGNWKIVSVPPVLGHLFSDEEESTSQEKPVALISYSLWEREFGKSRGALGNSIVLDRQSYKIVGVLPERYNFPIRTEVWIPTQIDPYSRRAYDVGARFLPGVSLEKARERLRELCATSLSQDPGVPGFEYRLIPIREALIGDEGKEALALFLVVVFVLLLACANVANLMLVRSLSRRKEFAIRVSLGATRGDLMRLIMIEGVLLSIVASVLGALFSIVLTHSLLTFIPLYLNGLGRGPIATDWRTACLTLTMAVGVGAMASFLPARRICHPGLHLNPAGKDFFRSVLANRRVLHLVVVGEIALAFVLLAGTAMMFRNLESLSRRDLGFRPENLLTFQITLPENRYAPGSDRIQFCDQLLSKAQSLPGVTAAAITSVPPVSSAGQNWTIPVITDAEFPIVEPYMVDQRLVSPDFFSTLRAHLTIGHGFVGADRDDSTRVAVVDETMARRLWPNQPAIGKHIRVDRPNEPWITVVGVVANIGDTEVKRGTVYLPYTQNALGPASQRFTLILFSKTKREALVNNARAAVAGIDRELAVSEIATVEDMRSHTLSRDRVGVWVASLFAVFGLILAALGIYSVMAFAMNQRIHETAVRIALGAQKFDILRTLLKNGGRLILLGIVTGVAGSFALSGLLSRLLTAASLDPGACVVASVCLTIVALIGCLLPGWKATRLNPVLLLKSE